ncbi:hypothetical protein [Clostridium ganghwense]|uniref:Uncharacterized protein n=1 Tax=Clostridium ganghwense TaxID=312089 RepID=A0ABT4CWJ9_9CLOT|nr:hypothetical protein [Clostridium ganghwense]MCY6372406.1 hypothetical protein [Clostridium ganghwense]
MLENKCEIRPISGRGQVITYKKTNEVWDIRWGKVHFEITDTDIQEILNNFFIDSEEWYLLGSSMDNPIKGGLGEYVQNHIRSLTPRHASAIAAILYNENLVSIKGKKPIYLKKSDKTY